ncbi:MAG: MotA/TolQ/ExbB proton channel family protein, partial [Bacteroidales bacterium]|nr:MotA/TolQ/ExbB proton channel family protein [Bacteroidales bacterium]
IGSRLGYKLQKNSQFKFLTVFAGSVIMTLLVYLILVPILKLFNTNGTAYVVDLLIHRGFIQYFTVFFFWVMIGLLVVNIFKVRFEHHAFLFVKTELDLSETMVFSDSQSILKNISNEKFDYIKDSLIVRRIKQGMQRLFNTQDTNALTEYFKLRSEIEYAEMDSGFSSVKYFNWLIPTLGFIGTVLGIGFGMAGFANIIENAQNFAEIKKYLPNVTTSLGVAFDTTFLALILSVIGMFLTSHISRKYGNFLEEIDSYCLDDISSRFKLHSTISEDLKDVLREMRVDIENLLNSSRIEYENRLESIIIQLNALNTAAVSINNNKVDLSGIVLLIKQLIEKTETARVPDLSVHLNELNKELKRFNNSLSEEKEKKSGKSKNSDITD